VESLWKVVFLGKNPRLVLEPELAEKETGVKKELLRPKEVPLDYVKLRELELERLEREFREWEAQWEAKRRESAAGRKPLAEQAQKDMEEQESLSEVKKVLEKEGRPIQFWITEAYKEIQITWGDIKDNRKTNPIFAKLYKVSSYTTPGGRKKLNYYRNTEVDMVKHYKDILKLSKSEIASMGILYAPKFKASGVHKDKLSEILLEYYWGGRDAADGAFLPGGIMRPHHYIFTAPRHSGDCRLHALVPVSGTWNARFNERNMGKSELLMWEVRFKSCYEVLKSGKIPVPNWWSVGDKKAYIQERMAFFGISGSSWFALVEHDGSIEGAPSALF